MGALETSREVEGYDGIKGGVKWWFESWGNGTADNWNLRGQVGRPPTPNELRSAEYITLALQFPDGHKEYRTRIGGIDV